VGYFILSHPVVCRILSVGYGRVNINFGQMVKCGDAWQWVKRGARVWVLPQYQIWCRSAHGGFWANRWNITKKFFIYTFLACSAKLLTWLYILLVLISFFFIFFNDLSETNYLRIRWTNFRNLFTEWMRLGCRWTIWTSFSDISRDVAMATNFVKKNG